MEIETKVLERIKKMLTLGNNEGATEAERETALRMAYNLMAKHNLTISDLPEEKSEEREKQSVYVVAGAWSRSLAQSIAKLFFCNYYYSCGNHTTKNTHYFIGLQSNTATAQYMAEYIIKSVSRESSRRYRSTTSAEGRSFCVGAVASIRSRVEDMLRNDTESTPGTAVALINLHASEALKNAEWLKNEGTNLKTSKARCSNVQFGAFMDGKSFGNTVSLVQQVPAGHNRQAIR